MAGTEILGGWGERLWLYEICLAPSCLRRGNGGDRNLRRLGKRTRPRDTGPNALRLRRRTRDWEGERWFTARLGFEPEASPSRVQCLNRSATTPPLSISAPELKQFSFPTDAPSQQLKYNSFFTNTIFANFTPPPSFLCPSLKWKFKRKEERKKKRRNKKAWGYSNLCRNWSIIQ